MRTTILVLGLATLTGCASILSKSTYPVTFDSNPTGATIVIRDKSGNIMFQGTAPTTLTLNASAGFFSPARYDVEATLPGCNPGRASLSAGLDGWYIGNILFGGLVGILIVDPATGAMWQLDSRVTVNLGASSGANTPGPTGPTRSVGANRGENAPSTASGNVLQLHMLTLAQVPLDVREHMVPIP